MSSDSSIVNLNSSQESSSEDNEANEINEKVRNALSLNAWHSVLQASCKFITGVLADVSSGRRFLHIKNPYRHLFLRSTQDLKNLEPLQPSIYSEATRNANQWIPRFKFMNKVTRDDPVLTEEMKLDILEQQLTLLIHASRCIKRQNESMRIDEYATTWPRCYNDTPYCHIMRCIFQHLANCRRKPGVCTLGFCEPAKRIISHFKNCPGPKCALCSRVSKLLPAKRNVRRNAIDDVDFETYLKRISRPRQSSTSSQSSSSSITEVPANRFVSPTYSGFDRIPAAYEAFETIDDNFQLDEPIITLNDDETM